MPEGVGDSEQRQNGQAVGAQEPTDGEQTYEQTARGQIEESDQELQRYLEGLEFDTPKFIAFGDAVESIGASSEVNHYVAEEYRVEAVGGKTDYYKPLISDAKRTLQDIKLRITDRENTVPGYLIAEEEFYDLYGQLYNDEKLRIKLDSDQEVVLSQEELRENPGGKLQLEVQAEAETSIWRKLNGARRNIIRRSSSGTASASTASEPPQPAPTEGV